MKDNIDEYKQFIFELEGRVESLLYTPPESLHDRLVSLHKRLCDALAFIKEQDRKWKKERERFSNNFHILFPLI